MAKAAAVRNKSELKCTVDEFAEFYLTAHPLYVEFEPLKFVRFFPDKDMTQTLLGVDISQPLGINGSECAYPVGRSEWIQLLVKLRALPAYQEMTGSEFLVDAIQAYLKSKGIEKSSDYYELYFVRMLSVIAFLYAYYLDEAERPISELILKDKERRKAVHAAQVLRSALTTMPMANYEEAGQLKLLLKRFARYSAKESMHRLPVPFKDKDTRNCDHALRLMVIRLVILFKIVNKDTNRALIMAIAKLAAPSVGPSSIKRHIDDGKNYLISVDALGDYYLDDLDEETLLADINGTPGFYGVLELRQRKKAMVSLRIKARKSR